MSGKRERQTQKDRTAGMTTIRTTEKEVEIRRAAEYFSKTSRCLEMYFDTGLSVRYAFPINSIIIHPKYFTVSDWLKPHA